MVQGKEPTHFFTLFKGRMVVHHGGKASGFKNVKDASEESKGKERALYHVRGTTDKNTHACQTVLEAASLNSGDCFILIIPGQRVYLWEGKYASPSERKFAHGVMASLAHVRLRFHSSRRASSPPHRSLLGGVVHGLRACLRGSVLRCAGRREPLRDRACVVFPTSTDLIRLTVSPPHRPPAGRERHRQGVGHSGGGVRDG